MSTAPQSDKNQTRATSIPGIERATGMNWSEWMTIFDSQGARSLAHPAIAIIARAAVPESLEKPDWWAQGIAIAYEQHVGIRVPGQSSTGTFRVSASRTLTMDRDAAIEAWASAYGERPEHLEHASGEPRQSRTEKRSFWRLDLEGAGRVEVSATPKDATRIILSVSQDGLPDGDSIEQWRAHWKSLLAAL